jgi:hypothetical protein
LHAFDFEVEWAIVSSLCLEGARKHSGVEVRRTSRPFSCLIEALELGDRPSLDHSGRVLAVVTGADQRVVKVDELIIPPVREWTVLAGGREFQAESMALLLDQTGSSEAPAIQGKQNGRF